MVLLKKKLGSSMVSEDTIKEDSPTVMSGRRRIAEMGSTLESMWKLFMRENSPTVMFGR